MNRDEKIKMYLRQKAGFTQAEISAMFQEIDAVPNVSARANVLWDGSQHAVEDNTEPATVGEVEAKFRQRYGAAGWSMTIGSDQGGER